MRFKLNSTLKCKKIDEGCVHECAPHNVLNKMNKLLNYCEGKYSEYDGHPQTHVLLPKRHWAFS